MGKMRKNEEPIQDWRGIPTAACPVCGCDWLRVAVHFDSATCLYGLKVDAFFRKRERMPSFSGVYTVGKPEGGTTGSALDDGRIGIVIFSSDCLNENGIEGDSHAGEGVKHLKRVSSVIGTAVGAINVTSVGLR